MGQINFDSVWLPCFTFSWRFNESYKYVVYVHYNEITIIYLHMESIINTYLTYNKYKNNNYTIVQEYCCFLVWLAFMCLSKLYLSKNVLAQ